MKWVILGVCAVAGSTLILAQFITIFVIQPIGAVPTGRTIIVTRGNTLHFIDSADAWCARQMGGVSLLCRGSVLARVAKETTILLLLPYSGTLYAISTGGVTYER
jgi:hypothetical protein